MTLPVFLKQWLMMMNRRRRIYEGKAKILYEGPEPGTLVQHFKDDATAFNAKKHAVLEGKGVLNNRISEFIFQHLNDIDATAGLDHRGKRQQRLFRFHDGVCESWIFRLDQQRKQIFQYEKIIPFQLVDFAKSVRRLWSNRLAGVKTY